jgi:hypothetical protein
MKRRIFITKSGGYMVEIDGVLLDRVFATIWEAKGVA